MSAAAVKKPKMASGANGVSLEEPKKMTREDWRKKKELEEQRKLGNAPAEVDEEGKDISPHIPQYISSVPWYIDPSRRPTLKHQRHQAEKQKEYNSSGDWYKGGVQEHSVATRYRRGACENCGALTHRRKHCMERPRKAGAKYTGMDIAQDEHVQSQLVFGYDGKRDRWNGYDPDEHMKIVEEYSKVDLAKCALKAQKLREELALGKLERSKRIYCFIIRGKELLPASLSPEDVVRIQRKKFMMTRQNPVFEWNLCIMYEVYEYATGCCF
uniref:Pre-mRNA-splicing factor SLU7 n=1 Tax=Zonotrichia albicollis TaxID=44394 RepID=A0A8D2MCP1_ZONAL